MYKYPGKKYMIRELLMLAFLLCALIGYLWYREATFFITAFLSLALTVAYCRTYFFFAIEVDGKNIYIKGTKSIVMLTRHAREVAISEVEKVELIIFNPLRFIYNGLEFTFKDGKRLYVAIPFLTLFTTSFGSKMLEELRRAGLPTAK